MIVAIRQYGEVLAWLDTTSRRDLTSTDIKRATALAERTGAVTTGYYDVVLTTVADKDDPRRDRDSVIEVR